MSEELILLRLDDIIRRLERMENGNGQISGKVPSLSDRQHAILIHVCRGESNKQIGRLLDLPESTVKVHVRELMRKLSCGNRTHVAIVATSMKLV